MQEQRKALLEACKQAFQENLWYTKQRRKALFESLEITEPQAIVLIALDQQQEECSMHELSEICGLSGAVLTGVVDRLQKVGLVVRQVDPQDRRVVMVALTPEGRKRHQMIRTVFDAAMEIDFQLLTDEELQQFNHFYQKFTEGTRRALVEADPAHTIGEPPPFFGNHC